MKYVKQKNRGGKNVLPSVCEAERRIHLCVNRYKVYIQLSRILPLKLRSWIAFSFKLYYAAVFNTEFNHSLTA